MCSTTAIECRTLHVIFISIVDHWSYCVGRTFVLWDDSRIFILCHYLSIISDAVFERTSDSFSLGIERQRFSPPFSFLFSFLFWRGTWPSVWFFRDRKIEGLSSILFPVLISFLFWRGTFVYVNTTTERLIFLSTVFDRENSHLDRIPGIRCILLCAVRVDPFLVETTLFFSTFWRGMFVYVNTTTTTERLIFLSGSLSLTVFVRETSPSLTVY